MRLVTLFRFALSLILTLGSINARAELSAKQVRKLITRMAGLDLPQSAVRVRKIHLIDDSAAEVSAEVKTAFRLTTSERGHWRVAEVRIGPNQWEPLAGSGSKNPDYAAICDGPDLNSRGAITEPGSKRARCLIAALLGVELPSDAVRIKTVSPLGLPLASSPSAVVEAVISADLSFVRDSRTGWAVTAVRTNNRDWINPDTLIAAANESKRKQAIAELTAIARALESFRADRGFYVSSDSHAVLIDHLSPRYLAGVVRVDPWHRPYQYQGNRDSFTLRSLGADGKENTADDVVVTAPSAQNPVPN